MVIVTARLRTKTSAWPCHDMPGVRFRAAPGSCSSSPSEADIGEIYFTTLLSLLRSPQGASLTTSTSKPYRHSVLLAHRWISLSPSAATPASVQKLSAMASVCPEEDGAYKTPALADNPSPHASGQQAIAVDATLAARQAQVCSSDMAAVRARLTPEQSERCSDRMINQFLRATVSNVDQVCLSCLAF